MSFENVYNFILGKQILFIIRFDKVILAVEKVKKRVNLNWREGMVFLYTFKSGVWVLVVDETLV